MPSDLQTLITSAPSATTLADGILLMVQGGEKRQAPASLFQPYDADLAAIAALTTTSFGRSLLTQANASAARTTLGLGINVDVQAYHVRLANLADLAPDDGVLANDGTGVLSWLGKSTGGNGSSDSGLLAVYDGSGILACTDQIRITGVGDTGIFSLIAPPSAVNHSLSLPLADAYLAATPNSDGSLSLFDLSDIPADAAGVLTSDGMGGLSWGAGGGGGSPFTDAIEVRDLTDATLKSVLGDSSLVWHADDNGAGGRFTGSLYPATLTANRSWALPDASGTLALRGANTFTGVQTFPGGSVSAPAITSATAGSTTGIYFSATNTIDFAIGGVRRVFIDSNGTINTNGSSVQITNGNLLGTNVYLRINGPALRMGASDDVTIGRAAAAVLQMGVDHATTATNQTIKAHNVTTGTGADLILKGGTGSVAAGRVCFGTHSAIGVETVTGYITIKDEGGTSRKLAVVS